jgi:hypothetical protein
MSMKEDRTVTAVLLNETAGARSDPHMKVGQIML